LQTSFIMKWNIFFQMSFLINCFSNRQLKQHPNTKLRIRRQVLINNVEKGVFHGETRFVESNSNQPIIYQFPTNTNSEALEVKLENEERKKLLDMLSAGIENESSKTLSDEPGTEAQLLLLNQINSQKEKKELLDLIQEQNEKIERIKLLDKLNEKQEADKERTELLNLIEAQKEKEEKIRLLNKIRNDQVAEKERKDLLNLIQEQEDKEERIKLLDALNNQQQADKERKELLNLIKEQKEKQDRIKLLDDISRAQKNSEDELLKKIISEREAEDRRRLLEKIYPDKIIANEDILNKIKQDANKRKALLQKIYSESHPSTVNDLLMNPYLGNRNSLVDEIKKLTPIPSKIQVRNTLAEMENIVAQLMGLGNALSLMEREVMLKGVYDRVKFLQNRSFC